MKILVYQSVSNKNKGFVIYDNNGKNGNKKIELWYDEFEGGLAYETDLEFIDDFDNLDEVLEHIKINYGKCKKIKEF